MTNKIKDVMYDGHVYVVWDYNGRHVFHDYTAAKTHIDGVCDPSPCFVSNRGEVRPGTISSR